MKKIPTIIDFIRFTIGGLVLIAGAVIMPKYLSKKLALEIANEIQKRCEVEND